jgi:hypothetical protein
LKESVLILGQDKRAPLLKGNSGTNGEGSNGKGSGASNIVRGGVIREVGDIAVVREDGALYSSSVLLAKSAINPIGSGSRVDVVDSHLEDVTNISLVSGRRSNITNEVNENVHDILATTIVLLNNEGDNNDKPSGDRLGLTSESVAEGTSVTRGSGYSGVNSGAGISS